MLLPVQLERTEDGGLTFYIRDDQLDGDSRILAEKFGEPFNMRYSNRPGSWLDKINKEIRRRGGKANAYLKIGEERVLSYERQVRWVRKPEIREDTIQLYTIPQEDAQRRTDFMRAFAMKC